MKTLVLASILLLAPWPALAQQPAGRPVGEAFDFLPGGTYDPAVLTPARLLGKPLGRRFTEHYRVVEIMRQYAATSPLARLQVYGQTEEERPLQVVTVSSPENLARLEEIRADIQSLVDPRGKSAEQIDRILARLPVVVWLSFNVHGNEPSSTEAAIGLLYQLVAGTDPRTESIRKNAIVVIDPCLNPDGRERFVRWFNAIVGDAPDPNPAAWEHHEPWPGGRVNHYFFDLNRDWAFLTQAESRARVEAYLRMPPQVHVDFHEMSHSSTYFFFPPEYPVNANLPAETFEWGKVFGRGNASAFDQFGWRYYTKENFDLFYPGYGDSWPSFQGAIGMTYEQAGHSSAGLVIQRDNDEMLTLRDRAWHHFIAAFATCETAVANKAALLRRFYEWHRSAIDEGEREPVREYVLAEGDDPARAASLAALLTAQGIRVDRAAASFIAGPLHDFDGKEIDRESFPAGTYLVPLAQPRKRLAKALLEPTAQLRDLYFYDVSAWSLPRAFGIAAYQLADPANVKRAPFDGTATRGGGVTGDAKPVYAYLLDWRQGNAPRLAASLLAEGTRVLIASKPFKLQGKEYPRGTAVIPAVGNGQDLVERLRVRAAEVGVNVTAVGSGLADEGIDLGSEQVRPLQPRRVLVATGPSVSASSFGAVRYLLERSFKIPFSNVPLEQLGRVKLEEFGAIVLPDGFGYDRVVSKDVIERLTHWVEGGGVIVGLGNGGRFATAERSGLSRIKMAKRVDPKEAVAEKGASAPKRYVPAEARENEARRSGNPGAILRLDLDPSSSVIYGCGDGPLYALATYEDAFDPSSGEVAAVFAQDPRVAGYVGSDALGRLAGQAFAITERRGRGKIVLFSEDPNFRLVWQGLTKAFLNAILLP